MHAHPRLPAGPSGAGAPGPSKSREQTITEAGGKPQFPNLRYGAYLVTYWQEAGAVLDGGFAAAKLTSQEVLAWQQLEGVSLQPWEARLIRMMSAAYIAQLRKSEEPECPPPYGSVFQAIDRDRIAKEAKRVFGQMAAAQQNKSKKRKKEKS